MQPRAVLATGLSAALAAAAGYDTVLAATGRAGGEDAHTAAVLIELAGVVLGAVCIARPTRRYADGSGLWLLWIVAGAALLCGAFTWIAPRGGAAATAMLLFVLAPITLLAADGH
jgi:hypothetical protein